MNQFANRETVSALISVSETVRYLNSSPATVYRLLQSGQLRRAKIGRRTYVRRVELEAFVARAAGVTELFE